MIKHAIKKVTSDKFRKNIREIEKILKWFINGRPEPLPAFAKRRFLKKIARKSKINIFIETGTFNGATVKSMKPFFKKIISIEVFPEFVNSAKEKFKRDDNIEIIEGDSGILLSKILFDINEPVFFWLDGHYSGEGTGKGALETPIIKEIESILNHKIKNHLILIDDARCFNGTSDYPKLEDFFNFVKRLNPSVSYEVKKDMIIIK